MCSGFFSTPPPPPVSASATLGLLLGLDPLPLVPEDAARMEVAGSGEERAHRVAGVVELGSPSLLHQLENERNLNLTIP